MRNLSCQWYSNALVYLIYKMRINFREFYHSENLFVFLKVCMLNGVISDTNTTTTTADCNVCVFCKAVFLSQCAGLISTY